MRPSNADIKRRLFTALISVIIVLIPLTAVAAPSTPEIEAKQEEALGAQSHVDDLQAELEMRAEEYAVINEKLQSTRVDVSQARDNLVEVEKEPSLVPPEQISGMTVAMDRLNFDVTTTFGIDFDERLDRPLIAC